MNSRTITTLVVGLVVLITVIALTQWQSQPSSDPVLLLPDLRTNINDVDEVTILGAGTTTIATLKKRDEQWAVSERADYPADLSKLRTLLLQLADARLVEKKTAKPELHNRLGVEDLANEDAQGVGLRLRGGTEADLIVGESAGADSRYVRRFDDPQSWLIDQEAQVPGEIGDWLAPEIIDISAGRVHAVTVIHPGGNQIRLIKNAPEESDFTILDVPPGRELSYGTVGNVIGGVLDGLTLDDVGVSEAGSETGSDQAVRTRFETFDGLVVNVNAEKVGDAHWIALEVEYSEELAARFAGTAPEEQGDELEGPPQGSAASPSADDGTKVLEEAKQINARVAGWRYQIPSFKFDQLTRDWPDLLKAESE